ncbi:AsmA family protein [Acidiphilium sp.]|uniref:AsmA family protein n=1 Tax=Acidiphilium sp. TaxID=527 RepID=UPI003CFD2414
MRRRWRRASIGALVAVVAVAVPMMAWRWSWFIPLVESRASIALGRQVSIGNLHIALGRVTTITADRIVIANPPSFPADKPFASIKRLTIGFNLIDYLFHDRLVLPSIDLDRPVIDAVETMQKTNNYSFHQSTTKKTGKSLELGILTIEQGRLHVVDPARESNVTLAIATTPATGIVAQGGQTEQLSATATGTYNRQPITARMTAGALFTLRGGAKPYPIDISVTNGQTDIVLVGTLANPLDFAGADLHLALSGANMADLYAITGLPIPATPHYSLASRLADHNGTITLTDFHGLVGTSDIAGTITVQPDAAVDHGKAKPAIHLDLTSKRVDLADLGGFIGATPGAKATPGAIKRATTRSANFLPDHAFSIPKLNAANIYLHYSAASIEGRSMPLDKFSATLTIINGVITLHPVSFGIGTGTISGAIALTPQPDNLIHAVASIDFDNVNVSKLMAATHVFKGDGLIQGKAVLSATGNSIASWAGNGNGGLSLYMTGGNLSDILVSLSGLQFGNALIAALGMPHQTDVRCFVGNFSLNDGIFVTRTLLLDTGSAIVRGGGTINMKTEAIDYHIRSIPKHFSIGSLPSPIEIGGTMSQPRMGPAKGPLIARGAAAVALGIIAAPLALIPTIQFGTKDPHVCGSLLAAAESRDHDDRATVGTRP